MVVWKLYYYFATSRLRKNDICCSPTPQPPVGPILMWKALTILMLFFHSLTSWQNNLFVCFIVICKDDVSEYWWLWSDKEKNALIFYNLKKKTFGAQKSTSGIWDHKPRFSKTLWNIFLCCITESSASVLCVYFQFVFWGLNNFSTFSRSIAVTTVTILTVFDLVPVGKQKINI